MAKKNMALLELPIPITAEEVNTHLDGKEKGCFEPTHSNTVTLKDRPKALIEKEISKNWKINEPV